MSKKENQPVFRTVRTKIPATGFEEKYQTNLRALRENPVRTSEPHNPGPSLSQFVEAIAGMGERARQNGTIARLVRTRKKQEKGST